jgi:hypothetical protein
MKIKFALMIPGMLFSIAAISQVSTQLPDSNNKIALKNEPQVHTTIIPAQETNSDLSQTTLYDTRLGSSSPLYNTYEKNDDGAGAITTNPNKTQDGEAPQIIILHPDSTDSNSAQPFYRDTRLGSSSPLYNTYEKNDYGAGAITTNPNKE